MALTATADAETRAEIVARLFDGRTPEIFLRGFDRPNLVLAFAPKDNPRRQILAFAAARRGLSGIVYCASRAKTEALAAALGDAGHTALAYHAGLDADDRRLAETRFQREDGLIVCATIAFGMGVDKPDIRYVAHADLPKSIEGYYQEIGRAGRDGAPADTLTLYGPDDIRLRRTQIDESPSPMERKQADHKRLNALLGLAEAKRLPPPDAARLLRRDAGRRPAATATSAATARRSSTRTEAARMAFSAMLRTGESFGAEHLIAILRGERTDKVRARGHDRLPTFGVGAARSKAEWQTIFRQLMGLDLVRPDPERHGACRLTEAARPMLRGEATLTLRADTVRRAAARTPSARRSPRSPRRTRACSRALKAHRRALADAAGVPAYVIFPDRTLIEMATRRPQTLDALARHHRRRRGQARALRPRLPRGAHRRRARPRSTRPAAASPASPEATLFDRLQAAQVALARGADGRGKYLNCTTRRSPASPSERPATLADLERVQRHGPAQGRALRRRLPRHPAGADEPRSQDRGE